MIRSPVNRMSLEEIIKRGNGAIYIFFEVSSGYARGTVLSVHADQCC